MDQSKPQAARIKLTENGPECSRIIAGAMKWGKWGKSFSTDDMSRQIDLCLSFGISTFDHADIYGDYTTESAFGAGLAKEPGRRKLIQLISKCGIRLKTENRPKHLIKSYDTSAAHIIQSTEQSLQNLKTDYLDILMIHRPSPLMDPDEIAQAFTHLREAGKVLHFGVSNFTPAQFGLLQERIPLVSNQIQISALHPAPFLDGSLIQAQRLGFAPMAWSPVGGAQMFQGQAEGRVARLQNKIREIAARHGVLEEQILIAWLFQHPAGILAVMGTTRADRLQAAVEAEDISLSRESWFEIWEASMGEEVP